MIFRLLRPHAFLAFLLQGGANVATLHPLRRPLKRNLLGAAAHFPARLPHPGREFHRTPLWLASRLAASDLSCNRLYACFMTQTI